MWALGLCINVTILPKTKRPFFRSAELPQLSIALIFVYCSKYQKAFLSLPQSCQRAFSLAVSGWVLLFWWSLQAMWLCFSLHFSEEWHCYHTALPVHTEAPGQALRHASAHCNGHALLHLGPGRSLQAFLVLSGPELPIYCSVGSWA